MDSSIRGWWGRHGWTVALLLIAFSMSFLLRTIFAWPILQQFGPLYVYGGGSDSFYHYRVSEYIIQNGHTLVHDAMLRFPVGAVNPREPLFDWMNAIFGILLAPFFGGSSASAAAFSLDLMGPLWSALTVFPVYLVGREVSSRRMGLIAALSYPFLTANIDSSVLGYANYLSFYSFFILLVVYGYVRTMKLAGTRRWVESYRHPRAILAGLKAFLRSERRAVKWAVFTGVSLGTLALAWQGYPFVIAVIVIFLVVAMVVERIRRLDSFGLYVLSWVVGLVGFPLAVPYYLAQGQFAYWFDLPLILYFGTLALLLPFLLLREFPWVVSLPVLVAVTAAGAAVLAFLDPSRFRSLITGQGYFVKTLVYSTVAEAQAPSIDALILGYGVITFLLAFVGLGLFLYRLGTQRFRREHMLFVVFAVISIFLPVSAAKFFYLGSAIFALLPAEIVVLFLDVGGYPTLRRNVASLSDRRSQFVAFRRAFKARHALVLLLVIGLLLPNIWYAIDAGIPYNSKSQYNEQIYNTLPSFLRTSPGNASSYYLGAAGTELDTPNQYDEAGYNWLAQQDQNLPPAQRPAFISWWDYGFQAVAEGGHPTVADNFQNGIEPAGQFLLSQNESQAIGVLATELLAAEGRVTGQPYLPAGLNRLLAADGVNVTELHTLLVNQSADIPLVIAHPERYLPVAAEHLSGINAMYLASSYYLATTLTPGGVAKLYNDIQAYTGWSIRYAMVDNRLFPFSGQNTGIFYAPADLTDRVIGAGGAPTAFFSITVTGSDGNTYQVGQVPAGVQPISYDIHRNAAFFNTMIYRVFVGYNGTDIGGQPGVPGLDQATAGDAPMPGWMLQHFQVVYRTAYYCPYSNPNAHPGCFTPMNLPDAERLAKGGNGTLVTGPSSAYQVGYYDAGEAILEYYPGVTLVGRVALPDGTPVPQAHVTVFDSWHIPHMSVTTGADGSYSLVLPPGNDTVNVSAGALDLKTMQAPTLLSSVAMAIPAALGLNPSAPTLVRAFTVKPATVQGFVYWNTANNTTYEPARDTLVAGATVNLWSVGGGAYHATTDASGAFSFPNLVPALYRFSVTYHGSNFTEPAVTASPGLPQNETTGLPAGRIGGSVLLPSKGPAAGAVVTAISSTGYRVSGAADGTGRYNLTNLGPGNYTIRATLAGTSLGSFGEFVQVSQPGESLTRNLTLSPEVSLEFPVLYQGEPLAGVPVRFAPITVFGPANATQGKGAGQQGPSAPPPNASLYFSDSEGVVHATVPYGNYSVYAFGLVGSHYLAGLANAYLPPNTPEFALAPLVLSPAVDVSGQLLVPSAGGPPPTGMLVTAFDARGDQVTTTANNSGGYLLALPAGRYSLLGYGVVTGAPQPFAAAVPLNLTSDTRENLTLFPATYFVSKVGTIVGPSAPFFPAAAAEVSIAIPGTGATLTTVGSANGTVTLVVPAIPGISTSYCLNASAAGFLPSSRCGLSAATLSSYPFVNLSLVRTTVRLALSGLPNGTAVQLNMSAIGIPALSTSRNGTGGLLFPANPGTYRVTAWARSPTSGIYLMAGPLDFTIPLGTRFTNLTVTLLHEVNTSGVLKLPSGITASDVAMTLAAPSLNVSVNGSAFARHFLAAPGSYTVYAFTNATGVAYAAVGTVTVNASGVVTPAVSLVRAATLAGLLTVPGGKPLNATVPVTLTTASGLSVLATAAAGSFSILLPANATYGVSVRASLIVPAFGGGSVLETYTSAPGAHCTLGANRTDCTVPLNASLTETALTASLVYRGNATAFAGSALLFGPSGAPMRVAVSAGRFSALLPPGEYSLYVTAGNGSLLGNASRLTVPLQTSYNVTIGLGPTWQASVTIAPPPGARGGVANVTFRGPGFFSMTFPNVTVGSPMALALPVGVWNVTANATYAPYGVPALASGTAALPLIAGNQAVSVSLAYAFSRSLSFTLAGPTSVLVPANTTLVYSYALRNTGNAPVTVRLVGSPSTWNFTFSPSNASLGLGAGNDTASGTVVIHVPAGTPVRHPEVILEAVDNVSGAVFATASPLPSISIVPVTGLKTGPAPTADQIAPLTAHIGFYVANPGNYPEAIALSVSDAARLAALGWTTYLSQGRSAVTAPVTVDAGANDTFSVVLAAPRGAALPPGSVTVFASVLNSSGAATSTLVLDVPELPLTVSNGTVEVTGPGIGAPSPYPSWFVPLLCFVPAIALVVALATYRWWRTRRWTRR